ncbi:alkaline phosphatase family protein [Pedobacter frigidisoli]|uniref:Alkaline phosphatase family protein n=1 Tax=Pedobacter frigidisoli TaxID=2530455 RepID=A0A4R0P2N6_9SPHI|nr:alkaline phosphatase family protein [Pedobacter frigidisoli]TCD08268.1 alkaline phosphatase family protein [Pedobacter frigidisoli]
MTNLFKSRYAILLGFIIYFLLFSLLIRSILFISSSQHSEFTFFEVLRFYTVGLFFDLGTALVLTALYSAYLLIIPERFYHQKWNRIFTFLIFLFFLVITLFSFFAELTFWQEFESRFNFIAVDYLIYTYEVIHNINESYPLPLLIAGMLIIASVITYIFYRLKLFENSFDSRTPRKPRIVISSSLIILAILFATFIKNSAAEHGNNRYVNELSKAGIYSFFAAFKNNELNYHDFYSLIGNDSAFKIVRNQLNEKGTTFKGINSIYREIKGTAAPYKPNVILITVESLSADFLAHYGNTERLTPTLDSIADNSIFFSDMYATGTRTVRGMEALTLAIPPTPGSSIVRRMDNENLFTVGHVFKDKGYVNTFFYGGDGYFDNMNHFFGSNGYNIVDRGRKLLNETYAGTRTLIQDKDVTFENAWGICDGDIFNVVIKDADTKYKQHRLFNNFIMTTSNHRPYTFPDHKINMPVGSREAAVRYTDYAIGNFLNQIKTKPWFDNTVVIIVADHCASSAGKNEIDISKYQIPCMILNLKNQPKMNISKMTSQIDLFPTLWSLLGWNYTSEFYGKDVLADTYEPRVFLGTYQKLVYLKGDSLVLLSPQRKVDTYLYNKAKNEQKPFKLPLRTVNEGIANYQTAFDLFTDGKLRLK